MQFLIVGLDREDDKATERRMTVRQDHIALGNELLEAGNLWFGAALYDEAGTINGSMYLVDFKDENELQAWLDREPYVRAGVWQDIQVRHANVRDPWQFSRSREFYEKRAESSNQLSRW